MQVEIPVPTLNFHKLFFQNPRFIIILLLQEGQESNEEGVKLMETFLQVLNNVFHWKTNLHCVNYYIALPWVPEVFFFRRGGEQELQRGEIKK